jgi:hypothetical protein
LVSVASPRSVQLALNRPGRRRAGSDGRPSKPLLFQPQATSLVLSSQSLSSLKQASCQNRLISAPIL